MKAEYDFSNGKLNPYKDKLSDPIDFEFDAEIYDLNKRKDKLKEGDYRSIIREGKTIDYESIS